MKDLSEIFSSLEGAMVEIRFVGAGPELGGSVESGRVMFAGTDYVALETHEGGEPHYVPFTSIRTFRPVKS